MLSPVAFTGNVSAVLTGPSPLVMCLHLFLAVLGANVICVVLWAWPWSQGRTVIAPMNNDLCTPGIVAVATANHECARPQ